jgi:hypothetical protein
MTPDLQAYAGQCTLGSLAPRLLGQCPIGSPFLLPRHDANPVLACYLLAHLHRPFPSPLYRFPMWPTLPPFLFLYSWIFSTHSVCSHLLNLVSRSRVFLPWRRKRHVPPKRLLTKYLHGATT